MKITKSGMMRFLLVNIGLILVAAGVYFFKTPNHFAIGGVSGISIIVASFMPNVPVGAWMMAVNIILLIAGFIFIGRDFGLKTAYASFALSGFVWIFELIYPMEAPFTPDTLLELCYSIMLPAVGSAILFNIDASTGGTDILAKILAMKTSLDIGKSLLLTDFVITVGAGFVFGIRVGLYCIFGLIIKAFLVDMVIENINTRKNVVIISAKPDEVQQFIIKDLHRGATVHTAYGAFTHEEKSVITTVLGRRQTVMLRDFIRKTDKSAFITITNSSEIIGKGFRSI